MFPDFRSSEDRSSTRLNGLSHNGKVFGGSGFCGSCPLESGWGDAEAGQADPSVSVLNVCLQSKFSFYF